MSVAARWLRVPISSGVGATHASPSVRSRRDLTGDACVAPTPIDDRSTIAEFSDRLILCLGCRYRITSEQQRIRIDGEHEHHCTNPAGYRFHIGCFRDAPGCVVWGAPTAEDTWFRGFAWRYALCGGCSAHLGWRFEAIESGFFGLVLNRLVTQDIERLDS